MIPDRTMEALDRYVTQGIPTGDFLYAVLTNDLFGAMALGDEGNLEALRAICLYVYNEIPGGCWGSKQKVAEWVEHRGKSGFNA